jgi:hypothetical protein
MAVYEGLQMEVLIYAVMKILFKTLSRWGKCISVLWDYAEI